MLKVIPVLSVCCWQYPLTYLLQNFFYPLALFHTLFPTASTLAPAPASTTQYAPMSSLPPRPGNMVVPPSMHPASTNTGSASASAGSGMGGGNAPLPHSTSPGNLQSVHGVQSVQGPPPAAHIAHAAPPTNAGGSNSGGSDFFEDIDLQSPDKQHHHYNANQHPTQHNNAGRANYNANPNDGSGCMYGQPSAAPYSSAPYNPSTAAHNASAWNSTASHTNPSPNNASSGSYNNTGGGGTPPTNQYGASTTPTATTSTTSSAPPASTGFFGFGGSSAAATTNTSTPPTNNTTLPPKGKTPTAAPAAAAPPQSSGGGFFSGLRKNLISTWYPDAHDANDNVGESLAAVYNKETGRWEFPGEVSAAEPFVFPAIYLDFCSRDRQRVTFVLLI